MEFLRTSLRASSIALRHGRVLLILWLVQTGSALIVVLPLRALLHGHLDHSLLGRTSELLPGDLVADLFRLFERNAPVIGATMLPALLVAGLSGPLLSGGVLGRLASGGRFAFPTFLSDCGRFAWRALRLQGWALLALLPIAGLVAAASALIGRRADSALFLASYDRLRLGVMALALLMFLVWRAAFDVARAHAFTRDIRKTRVAAWRSLKLVLTRPWLLGGYVLAAAALAVALLAGVARSGVPVSTTGGAWLAWLMGQGVLLARLASWLGTNAFALDIESLAQPAPGRAGSVAAPETSAPAY